MNQFEIVQLGTGEVILRKKDVREEPMIIIKFSRDAHFTIGPMLAQIAQEMIRTGVQQVNEILGAEEENNHTLH